MPSFPLSTTDYPEIRAVLDVALDATMLPDAIIGFDAYVGEAQRDVLARDPSAASRTGDAAARVRLAAIYLTAARLATALPVIVSETFGDERYQRQAVDLAKLAAQLRQLADDAFGGYLTPEGTTPTYGFSFGLARGCRGR